MTEIDWICQGCGKTHNDALAYPAFEDAVKCNRCGWVRNIKTREVLQRENDVKKGIIRDENGKEVMSGMFYRMNLEPMVRSSPASRLPRKKDCCCPCPSTYM